MNRSQAVQHYAGDSSFSSLPRPACTLLVLVLAALLGAPAYASEAVVGKPADGLVFAAGSSEGLDLYRARLSDGALQRLSATDDLDERWPKWNGTAGQIAYLERNLQGMMKSNVMLLDPRNGERKNVRANPDLVQRSHEWSPDGGFVAHTFRMPPSDAKEKTNAGTVLVDVAKGEREIVSESEEIGYRMQSLSFSHDGKRIVGHGRNPKQSNDDKLWLLQSGQKPKAIAGIPRGIYDSPAFTRDGKTVVFDYQQVRGQPRDVMQIELAVGKRVKRIASTPRSDDHTAVVSPTRDEMLIISDRIGNENLLLVDLATGKPKILTKDPDRVAAHPVWSPDGNRIAYVAIPNKLHEKSEKNFEDYLVRVIDREGKRLFETAGTMPAFMPPWKGDQPVASFAQPKNETKSAK